MNTIEIEGTIGGIDVEGFVRRGRRAQAAVDVLTRQEPGQATRKPSRVAGGRDAQAGGKAFEAALDVTHRAYEASGTALIRRLPVETQPMPPSWLKSPKGGVARILSARQGADYFGVVDGGRFVLMEAKSNVEHHRSLPIVKAEKGKSSFGLKDTQLRALVEARGYGALVAVVWRNAGSGIVFSGEILERAWREYRLGQTTRIDVLNGALYQTVKLGGLEIEDWLPVARSEDALCPPENLAKKR